MLAADKALMECPVCGTVFCACADAEPPVAGVIVIVERPDGWTPGSELDMPTSAVVEEIVEDTISHPPTFIRQFNATSRDNHGTTWSAVTNDNPQPGKPAELVPL